MEHEWQGVVLPEGFEVIAGPGEPLPDGLHPLPDIGKPPAGGMILPEGFEVIGEPTAVPEVAAPAPPAPMQVPGTSEQSASDTFGQAIDMIQMMLGGTTEALGEAAGSDTLTDWGRDVRERNRDEAAAYGDPKTIDDVESWGDFGQWLKETFIRQSPQIAASVASGYAGAKGGAALGAPFGPVGAGIGGTVGGIGGAFVPSFVLGTGEVQSGIKEKDPDAVNPGAAFAGGAAIAALDSILPGKVGGALVRQFGRETAEKVAQSALKRISKGAVKGAAIEGGTEAVQEAIAEVAASHGADQPVDFPGMLSQMKEGAAAGALMGGFVGGAGSAIPGRRATEQPETLPEAPQEPAQAETAPKAVEVPERPREPLQTAQKPENTPQAEPEPVRQPEVPQAEPQPETEPEAEASRTIGSRTARFPDAVHATVYDYAGKVNEVEKANPTNGAMSPGDRQQVRERIAARLAEDRQAVADTLGIAPERLDEIAQAYRSRVIRAAKKSSGRDFDAPPIDERMLAQWRTERGESPPAQATAEPKPQPQVPAPPGQTERSRVFTPDNDAIEVETDVVEADTLVTSDMDGYPPELQPRDRDSRKSSEVQIESIANAPNPERLDQSPESDRGSPIVAPEGGVVESGNGRVMGLRRAYERGTADAYRQYVTGRFPAAADMRRPVIVRRRVTDVDREDFTYASNQSATLAMSASESAQAEARLIDGGIIALYKGGDILNAGNRPMVRAFIKRLPRAAQGSLVTAQGGLSVEGQRRFEAAVFARAYGDPALLARMAERTDDDMVSVTNTLRQAAPDIVRHRLAMENGQVSPDTEIASHIVAAMQVLGDIRARGSNLAEFRAQADAFAEPPSKLANAILTAFHNEAGTRLASKDKMLDFLHRFILTAMEQRIDQGNLPGVEPKPLKNAEQIANETLSAQRDKPPDTGKLFEDRGGPSGTADRTERHPPGIADRGESAGRDGQEVQRSTLSQSGEAGAAGRRDAGSRSQGTGPGQGSELEADTAPTRAPRGGLTPRTQDVSFTSEGAIDEQAYIDAGYARDEGQLLKPAQKKAALARVLEDRFGLKIDYSVKGAKIATLDAVDQMLDAWRGIRFMLHTLSLPEEAISLGGTLTIALERYKGRYFGAYRPDTRTIHMPGRSNSFAHEWMHALDHHLRDTLTPKSLSLLLSRAARGEGLDASDGVQGAFVNVIHKMFFDEADLALKMLNLEQEANGTTKTAKAARQKLERLCSGATRMRIAASAYRQSSADFGQGSDYWTSVHEMLARAFEAYIAYKVEAAGGQNAFITKGDAAYLSDADERLARTFPKGAERMAIFAAFDELFDHIRSAALLGEGPATARPTDKALADKRYYLRALRAMEGAGETDGVKQEFSTLFVRFRNVLNNPGRRTAGESLAGIGGKLGTMRRHTADFLRLMTYSVRSRTNAIIARQPDEAKPFLDYIASQLMTDPGTGKLRPENMPEEINRTTKRTASRIEAALKVTGVKRGWKGGLPDSDNDIVRELLFGENPDGAQAPHKALAAELRRIMDDFWREARNAGLSIGYVENTGYLPRVLNTEKVEQNREAFTAAADKVYRLQFDRMTEDIEVDDLVQLASAISHKVAGAEHLSVAKGPFGAQVTALRAALKKNPKAPKDTPDDLAAADAAEENAEAVDAAMEDLKAAIRADYASQSAADWLDRIIRGDSMTFDSLGPAAGFLKSRKLPPEADQLLGDFHETDVIHSVMGYALHASSRANYVRRFGQSGGADRFRQIIAREDIRQAMEANPKTYDRNSGQGRLAIIRDLADRSRDNILELILEQAAAVDGVLSEDIATMRGTVELLTGRSTRGFFQDASRRVTSAVMLTGTAMLLGRAAFSSLAEPLVTGLRTRSTKAGFRTFTAYLSETVRSLDSVQERAELARAMGLVASPFFDVTVMGRSGFDPQDIIRTRTILSRFFRATALTQVTNASRRAVMTGGTFWLRDLGQQYLDNATSAKKRELIKAEFRDLGLADEQMTDMAEWLAKLNGLPEPDMLDTPEGRLYEKTINRLVNQTIQEPNRADKATYAATPLGRLPYALASFLYAFWQNIQLAAVKRTRTKYRIGRDLGEGRLEAGVSAVGGEMTAFAAGFAALWLGHLAVTIVREAVFNQNQWEAREEEGELEQWLSELALSRTGIFGPGDILINMYRGIRYERDVSSILVGPYLATMASHIQNILGLSARNSPNTNTAEHRAVRSAWQLLAVPLFNILASSVPAAGPLTWTARFAAMQGISAPGTATAVADAAVGEKGRKKKPGKASIWEGM